MISQTLFVKTIEALHEQYNHDKESAYKLGQMYNCEISGSYNTSYLSNAILDLLRVHFPMVDGHCEIEHYAYICNFGKIGDDYESPEQLYDRLTNESSESLNYIMHTPDELNSFLGRRNPSLDPNHINNCDNPSFKGFM